MWSTHQFWVAFLREIGIASENIVFSSDTSEEQGREFGKGRGTVDCCYPVKAMSGHYGELVFGQKKKVNVIMSPMIYSLPSFMRGHVSENLACTRVMAGPENIRAGFVKESDVFGDNGIQYASPFVNMAEPEMVPKQMYDCLKDVFDLDMAETQRAVDAGYKALREFNRKGARRNAKNSDLVRARKQTVRAGAGPAVSHGPGNRPRDRIRFAGARLSHRLAAISAGG